MSAEKCDLCGFVHPGEPCPTDEFDGPFGEDLTDEDGELDLIVDPLLSDEDVQSILDEEAEAERERREHGWSL